MTAMVECGPGPMRPVRTTCPYCGVGCGVEVRRGKTGTVEAPLYQISGDPGHPANYGRLCSKGAALHETLGDEGRLLYPMIGGARVSWEMALSHVAGELRRLIGEYGPDAVAFYVSGQFLTEDYYVANKLMKGFIGSANIDTNSRLCMSSSVAGHKRAFGSDTVPGVYEDLEAADCLVLTGSNAAWCHPVLYQRMMQARERRPGAKLVVIDPRRTASASAADLHLAIAPGSDVALFNGLLVHLSENGGFDHGFITAHCSGFDEALAAARRDAPDIGAVAALCQVEAAAVAQFYEWFTATPRVVTLYSQGVNQSSQGTDKVNAILNCHLASGRIGRKGMGPFSLTGQPNAMGGREVGGLANQLAAHMEIDDPAHRQLVQTFWEAPHLPASAGLKAVDLFHAIEEKKVRAVWIMATNPVFSLPDADRVRRALAGCELVVVSDCMARTDTADCAHVLLPAAAWGEKDGTVTNSERRISRQRRFRLSPGEARPDWWIMCNVARRMGFSKGFDFSGPAAIFREHAALSAHGNEGRRDFDIGALADLDEAAYDALPPVQWPLVRGDKIKEGETRRFFAEGRFFTADGRGRLVPVRVLPPVHAPAPDYPLILNTGRDRDHWHSMTRTGLSPRLSSHRFEPLLEIHPEDAAAAGIGDQQIAEIESRWGAMLARVLVSEGQSRGSVFVPIHWNGQFAAQSRVDALVNPVCDPLSGQPEAKHTPVRVRPFAADWQGFALSSVPLSGESLSVESPYWVRAAGIGHWRYELAGPGRPGGASGKTPEDWAKALLFPALEKGEVEWIQYRDSAAGRYRFAAISGDRLLACLFVGPMAERVATDWLAGLFAPAAEGAALDGAARLSLLAGGPPQGPDLGPVVCACFGVRRGTIERAITEDGLASVEAIGTALGAGSNCGSCRVEIRGLLAACTTGTEAAALS